MILNMYTKHVTKITEGEQLLKSGDHSASCSLLFYYFYTYLHTQINKYSNWDLDESYELIEFASPTIRIIVPLHAHLDIILIRDVTS